MPKFRRRSKTNLLSCHPDLIRVFDVVIEHFDCSVLCGHRGETEQDEPYLSIPPKTKVQYPNSKHNSKPSMAVDVVPYPIDWSDKERFYYFAGFVKGIAKSMGIDLRWGGDWDSDTEVKDQTFMDLPHFEIKEEL